MQIKNVHPESRTRGPRLNRRSKDHCANDPYYTKYHYFLQFIPMCTHTRIYRVYLIHFIAKAVMNRCSLGSDLPEPRCHRNRILRWN